MLMSSMPRFKLAVRAVTHNALSLNEQRSLQILSIHLQRPPGDILVFMTGQEDIEATCQVVAERMERIGEGVPPLLLLPMYSQLPSDLQVCIPK